MMKGIKMNKKIIAGIIATASIGVLAACSPSHSSTLHAVGKSSRVQNAAQIEQGKLGIPSTSLGQIEYAKQLTTTSGRHAVEVKADIPAKNRTAFEAAVLGAAENGHLTNPGNTKTFLEVTLPAIALKYQN